MATQTEIESIISTLETFLTAGHGVKSVSVDGLTTVYDRKDARQALEYWRGRLNQLSVTKPRVSRITLNAGSDTA